MKILSIAVLVLLTLGLANAACHLKTELGCIQFDGNTGWLRFCPVPQEFVDAKDGINDECVNIRPSKFLEKDLAGNPISEHSVETLSPAMLMRAGSGSFDTECSEYNNYVCGHSSSSPTGTVDFDVVVFRVALWSGSAPLQLQLFIFTTDGTISFGGTNANVVAGAFKYNMRFRNYEFCGFGTTCDGHMGYSAELHLEVSNKNQQSSLWSGSSQIFGIQHFPHDWAMNGTSTNVAWFPSNTATATQAASNTHTIEYHFQGPFNILFYDPLIQGF